MGSYQPTPGARLIDLSPQTMDQNSQVLGTEEHDTSPSGLTFAFEYDDDVQGTFEERDDGKRRRIARVKQHGPPLRRGAETDGLGLRHVPEEEDQMRWQDASLYALHQLQDRVQLHARREEACSSKRVSRN